MVLGSKEYKIYIVQNVSKVNCFHTACGGKFTQIVAACTGMQMDHIHHTNLHRLCNPEIQCRIHKGSPIKTILSQINSILRLIPI